MQPCRSGCIRLQVAAVWRRSRATRTPSFACTSLPTASTSQQARRNRALLWDVAACCMPHIVRRMFECMAAGSHDCSVRLWERGTARCLHEFHGHTEAVCAASTQRLSNALRANTVQLSCRSREHTADNSLALHRPLRSPTRADRHSVSECHATRARAPHAAGKLCFVFGVLCRYCVCFSADSATLASGSHDCSVRLWDVPGHKRVRALVRWSTTVECSLLGFLNSYCSTSAAAA